MWAIARDLQVPLDTKIKELNDIPYTITYVIRKRMQIDNLNELPEEKRPPELMIWDGTQEELQSWIDRVVRGKESKTAEIVIPDYEIEG